MVCTTIYSHPVRISYYIEWTSNTIFTLIDWLIIGTLLMRIQLYITVCKVWASFSTFVSWFETSMLEGRALYNLVPTQYNLSGN